ncbi:MAG TPA: amidohydrolase [Dongiaceae bacterium]|nr:amidohydrolase [Dongiaceae bacterium]
MAEFTVIRGGQVVEARPRGAQLADLLVEGDTIREIGPPAMPAPDGSKVIDASGKAIMPGFVNGHVHGHGTLAKGLVEDRWPLELFLNALPGLAGNRSLEDKRLNGLVAAVEMIRKGCTACYDLFFEFPMPSRDGIEALGRAYAEAGVRAVIAPMVADFTLYQAYPGLTDAIPEPLRRQVQKIELAPYEATADAAEDVFRNWPFDRSQIRPAIAPTIPLHCSDPFLLRCRDLARSYDIPLQTHLAETKSQAILGMRKYGCSLTRHLDDLGMLGPHLSAAHAIWLDDEDLRRLADRGVSAIHAPASNMRFGSGLAPLRAMLDLQMNVGIATDAANSSDSLNMFESTRLAAFISRVLTPDFRRWLGADEVFYMSTEGSARAMGLGGMIGQVAKGYKADLVFLDLHHINYVPLHDLLGQIVFTENGAAVDSVMAGGRMILDRGRITTVDESKLRRDVEAAAARLSAANLPMRKLSGAVQDMIGRFCRALAHERYHVSRQAWREEELSD